MVQHAGVNTSRDRVEAAYRRDGPRLWRALVVFTGDRELASDAVAELSSRLARFVSAVHAYEVSEALTFVEHGRELPDYQK